MQWYWHPAEVKRRNPYEPADLTETRLVWKKRGSWQQPSNGQLKVSQWPVKPRPEQPYTFIGAWAEATAHRDRTRKKTFIIELAILMEEKLGSWKDKVTQQTAASCCFIHSQSYIWWVESAYARCKLMMAIRKKRRIAVQLHRPAPITT